MDYRYGSHTVFKIQYHFVFVTKYRYHVLKGDVALKTRELIRQSCEAFEIEILKGVVSKDHIHILVSAPPNLAPSEIMRRIKGRTATKLFETFPEGSPGSHGALPDLMGLSRISWGYVIIKFNNLRVMPR